ncbi:MAG: cofactor-independent phosphoglycerate mutase [Candidatus Omnitrophica bacterium]|nr:cofactor-independent phosphoglycerate mutase [Candidatus Omnitrophota bacterium]
MKYIVLVPDGMAGLPLEELNDRTCMEAAITPNMDTIAREGIVGMSQNIPKGMVPASDVANLSILGYDPRKYYCGRGPMEAANLGVRLEEEDVAFRFNLVTCFDDKMMDYSAGHITTEETRVLVKELDRKLGSDRVKFYPGTSYRNLMVIKCSSPEEASALTGVKCFPPHDILERAVTKFMPKNAELVEIMERSKTVLQDHDINKVRIDLGQNPGNMIWAWGQGKSPDMPTMKEAYGVTGGIISAVDLLKGIGRIIGLEVIEVEGATGYYDTNYEGKARAALKVLENKDFVFVHVEAADEAGHNGDMREKIKAIENFDSKITGPVLKAFDGRDDFRVLLLPDHPTPIKMRTHTADPVPFAMMGAGVTADTVTVFTERSARAGSRFLSKGHELMKLLMSDSI